MFFRSAFTVFVIVFGSFCSFGQSAQLTKEQWRADLRFLADEMPKRHKNLFHTMTRDQFDTAVKDLDAKIPSMTPRQIELGMARIVTMVGDGHTGLWLAFLPEVGLRAIPVKFYLFREGLFIQSASPENAAIVGAKVIKIGNSTSDDAIKAVTDLVPRDNIYGIKDTAPTYLLSPEILHAIGMIKNAESVELTIEKNGNQKKVELKPTGLLADLVRTEARKSWANAFDESKNPKPLWMQRPQEPFWFEYVPSGKLLYVQLNQVLNKQDESLEAFFARVVEAIAKNDVEKCVLDLRLNGGGNNGLVSHVIRAIVKADKIDQKGKFFAIIGRRTFSAAQNLVNELEKYTKVTFVGEPTGSRVNMFGDARPIFLPNSKLRINISSLWWQNMVELDRRTWTSPQLAAAPSFKDYADNKDAAIEAISKYKPRPSLTELVRADFDPGNMAAVKTKLIEFRKDPANEFVSVEAEINTTGYRLLADQRTAQAIELFKLNTELYPDSANVFDSLGEAFESANRKDEAIKAFEKALQIDPNYQSSVDALRRLKGK
jgi:tetratricopeptide (TPR) repeat protein